MQVGNGMTLDCDGFTINYSAVSVGYGVSVSNINNTLIKNCVIRDSYNITNAHAIYSISFNYNITLDSNDILTYGNAYGIYNTRSNFLNISNNSVQIWGSTARGISTSANNSYVAFNNVTTNGSSTAHGFEGLANTENSVIANNLFVTAGTGSGQAIAVYLGQYRNVLIANNSIRTNSTTGHGIDLSSCSNITATNNDIRVFGIYGIAFRVRNSANVFANTNYFYSYQSTNIGLTNTTTTYFTGITPNGITINFVTPATNPASFNYLNLTSGSFVNMTTNSTTNVTFQSFSWNNESVYFNFGFPTTSTNVYWFFGGMKPSEYYEYKRNAVIWDYNQTDNNGL
jgi:hypothetical protein